MLISLWSWNCQDPVGLIQKGLQMKQTEILKVLKAELGTDQVDEINKKLKAKGFSTKFRITGPTVVHFGFTGLIKALTPEGVKVFNVNKVTLIRYDDIETFAKAKPRERLEIPEKVKPPVQPKKPSKKVIEDDEEDYDNDDDFDPLADEEDDVIETDDFKPSITALKKKKEFKKKVSNPGTGSLYIPKKK